MNKPNIKASILALTTLTASFGAIADGDFGNDKRFYVAAQATYNYFDSDSNLVDKEGITLSIGKPIFSWLDLELQAFNVDAADAADNEIDYQGYGLATRLYPGRYTMPFYAVLGYSVGDDGTLGATEDASFIDLGVGYTHAFTQHGSSIRAEYRARRTDVDGINIEPVNHIVALGLEIPFGASKPLNQSKQGTPNYRNVEVAQRPATASWDNQTPCADADFDGVCDFGDQCPNTPVGIEADGLGCSPSTPAAPEAKPLPTEPMVLEGVEFEFNSDTLTTASMPILDRAAETLRAHRGVPVEVAGHTDSKGSFTYNLNLSTLRAKAVKEYLVSKGVSAHRLSFKGYGESDPIADNQNADGSDNPEGRARNRRVELRAQQ